MKIIKLYTAPNQRSYFEEIDSGVSTIEELGQYSAKYPVNGLYFREFKAGNNFAWHNAPQAQYIIYLEGEVEVEASGGETRRFLPGDILFATDLTGQGHITRTLTNGKSLIITTQ